ncbi:MAG: phenylalanine--tRNA ligase subunit beta [Burkholderiales bacterium]
MKFSENWLRSFVNPPLTSEQLAHALTMAGLEVEALESVAPPFANILVAEVLELAKHPEADRLNVCRVNAGGEALQIVCGAGNVAPGIKVPCAVVGAVLPGGMEIKRAKLRGVESHGMLCSAKELGLAESSDGLLVLAADAPVGASIRDYLGLDDKLFTLKLTPNRSDCLSLYGVAREVAAVTDCALTSLEIRPAAVASARKLALRVERPDACPRYAGRVITGIDPQAGTPPWMVRRLERSGLRSLGPVVDVSNYVLLELGQPMHAFDLAKIDGGITVRFAHPGERLRLLNEQTVDLQADMLVIADDAKALALAGIMGGADSAVSAATVDIFLESAFFSPAAIAGKSRQLGFGSDSSYRFERGVDFGNTVTALERATQLIQEICGGAAGEIVESVGPLPLRAPVAVRAERVRRVLGIDLDDATVGALLGRLRLECRADGGVFQITPPSYRFDLAIEEDFIEEVARLHGYEHIPEPSPRAALTLLPVPEDARALPALKQLLAACDYQEIISYAFVDEAWERDFAANAEPVRLLNPIAAQLSVMRSSLIGGLVDCLRTNLNRKQSRVRVFEAGGCFIRDGETIRQPVRLAGLCYGNALPEQWGEPSRGVDFFDVKADVEALFQPLSVRFEAAGHPAFHPGQSARISLHGEFAGWMGTLHPRWRQEYGLPGNAVVFELELPALLARKKPAYAEISKFPAMRRDLAVVVAEDVGVQAMLDALREGAPEMLTELSLFDVYRGKGIDSDHKSLAFQVLLQDTRKTLTDEEVDTVMARLLDLLVDRFDAKLRN